MEKPKSVKIKDENIDWSVSIEKNLKKKISRSLLTIEPLKTKQKEIEKHLHNIRIILLNSNATPIRSHTGIGYSCCYCDKHFPLPKDLKTHTIEKHGVTAKTRFMKGYPLPSYVVKLDITDLKCQLCSKQIEGLKQLMQHLNCHHDKKIYDDINNHILPFRFEGDTLNCALCSRSYERFKLLQEHMNTHYRNYNCEICNSPFVNKRTLKNHVARHKQGEFSCSFCPKVFDTHTKKSNHEKFVHIGDDRRNKCPYCGEKFTTYAKKNEHMVKEHGEKPLELKCMACDKTFTRRDRLTRHTKRDHLLERKYDCEHCEMKFYGKKELSNHMLKHTGIKRYRCEVCQKAFGRKHTLREHLRIHADDRRFKCEHCGQAFVQKCSWKSHMRSKHDENV